MYRSICVRASLLCCVVACVAPSDEAATADSVAADELGVAPLATTVVQFQRINTTLCLTENVSGNPKIFEGVCDRNNKRQRWSWLTDSLGSKFVPQSVPTNCLDVQGGSKSSGAQIVFADCASDLNQEWLSFSTPLLGFQIKNVNGHLCMTRTSVGFVQQPCDPNSAVQNFLLNTL